MEIKDLAIVLSMKNIKENLYVVNFLTQNHGLYSSAVKISKLTKSVILVGNIVDFFWYSRLESQLGKAKCDLIHSYSYYILNDKIKLYALNSIISLIQLFFVKKEKTKEFFDLFHLFIQNMKNPFDINLYLRLELHILKECGYGLLLDKCGVTGSKDFLYYISPKSGHAISQKIGYKYRNKLLRIPRLFVEEICEKITYDDVNNAFYVTTYFFEKYLLKGKNLFSRDFFISNILNVFDRQML